MSLTEILGLMTAAAAGGAINAVAGGGTLVTFPALLFFGTPPIVANATSTLALVIGTSGSIYGYRKHLDPVKPWLWRFALVSTVGGLIGAVLLTWTSNRTFSKLVPFLILFATVLFLAQGAFRRFAGLNGTTSPDRQAPRRLGRDPVPVRGGDLRGLLRRGHRHPDAGLAGLHRLEQHPRDEHAQDDPRLRSSTSSRRCGSFGRG